MIHTSSHLSPSQGILASLTALSLTLSACSPAANEPEGDAQAETAPAPDETESISILRPEIEPPAPEPTKAALQPLTLTIGFPDGGSALGSDAIAALETAMSSDQMALGLPITLGAHSDSAGTDKANLDASEKRGLAVAKWLVDQGVAADRITVIAFGEQNPASPNAQPDGSPNEEGRAANRRVDISIAVQTPEAQEPEELAVPVETASVETGSVEAGN